VSEISPEIKINSADKKYLGSPEIINMKRKKRNLWKKAKKNNSEVLFQRCHKLSVEIKSKILEKQKKRIKNKVRMKLTIIWAKQKIWIYQHN